MAASMGVDVVNEGLVPAGPIRLHVTELGEGRPLVWLHGSGPGSTSVGTFADHLPAFAHRRNLLIDLPRFGRSDRPDVEGPMIHYAAARLADVLDTLGVRRADFVGNSYGGGVSIRLAAE